MNEQKAPGMIEWTRVRNPDGTVRRGFTWNPIAGCLHDCEWVMPDGKRAECYAKTVAEKFSAAYKNGFASYYWHPKRLDEPKRQLEGAGIFCDSMSDLFGHWVKPEHQAQVLNVMRDTPQHIYQALTKNTVAYRNVEHLPLNMWAGISSPPDHFMGNDLNDKQKERYLHAALRTLSEVAERGTITWMSFEPLSRDWAHIVREYPGALKWAVIGAASNGSKLYPPREHDVHELVCTLLGQGVKIFYKGNMRSLPYAVEHWREDFPALNPQPTPPAGDR